MLIHVAGIFLVSLVLIIYPFPATIPTPGIAMGQVLYSTTALRSVVVRKTFEQGKGLLLEFGWREEAARMQTAPSKSNSKSRFDK